MARCLCLAGARIDTKNREGVVPELCALAQGHAGLGNLLGRLKREGGGASCEDYIEQVMMKMMMIMKMMIMIFVEQLIPTVAPITKIKVKFFGHSGVGKTTLIESLKAGYFSSLFRRSRRTNNNNNNVNNNKGGSREPQWIMVVE